MIWELRTGVGLSRVDLTEWRAYEDLRKSYHVCCAKALKVLLCFLACCVHRSCFEASCSTDAQRTHFLNALLSRW